MNRRISSELMRDFMKMMWRLDRCKTEDDRLETLHLFYYADEDEKKRNLTRIKDGKLAVNSRGLPKILMLPEAYEEPDETIAEIEKFCAETANLEVCDNIAELIDKHFIKLFNKQKVSNVPKKYLNRYLDSDEKKELVEELGFLGVRAKKIKGWATVKKILIDNGYKVKDVRKGNKRFSMISFE